MKGCCFVMKNAKKTLVLVLLALSIFSGTVPSYAFEREVSYQTELSARAIETEWKYRLHDGQRQKRLWSNTQLKWLTDWMPV